MAGEGVAKLGEGGESRPAKSLKTLARVRGEGGEGEAAKSLKSLRRRLAKVAKRRTPIPLGRTFARLEAARSASFRGKYDAQPC